jgi:serine/threonine-protein kinase RsbW
MIKTKKYGSLIASSDNSELSRIRDFVEQNAIQFGFDESNSQKIALAVDEACSNLIKHAYKLDKSKNIWINIETQSNEFVVKIIDEGNPFDPLEVPKPDMKKYFKSYKRGGLGIQIMRLVMDKINYFPSNGGNTKNILELRKVLN